MNIAIINIMAKTTSTGKIAHGLYEHLLERGHRARVYYGHPDPGAAGEEDLVRVCGEWEFRFNAGLTRLFGGEGLYARRATRRLIRALEADPPDAVCLMNLHAYYLNLPMLFSWLGEKNLRTVYVMLDDAPFLGKCCFSYDCGRYREECGRCPLVRDYPKSLFFDRSRRLLRMKRDAYAKVKDLTFVGIPYTVERAKGSALLKNARLVPLDEAVDLRRLYYPRETGGLRRKLGIPEENKVILTVSPFSNPRKGGRYFLQAAESLRDRGDITFIHVGFDGDPKLCPPNEIPVPYVSDQNELAEFYSLADLFVCTSLAETVANTCLEALSCGTPILSFNTSGMPYCADAAHGTFVEAGDVGALAAAVAAAERKSPERIASCRRYAESRYDSRMYFEGLEKLLLGEDCP